MASNKYDETENPPTLLNHCLRFRGRKDTENQCIICPLPGSVCKKAIDEIEKQLNILRRRDSQLGTADKNKILEEVLEDFIIRYKDPDQKLIEDVTSSVRGIFKHKRADHYRQAPQYTEISEVYVANPPQPQLDDLVQNSNEYLTFHGSVLSTKPNMPKTLYFSLLQLSLEMEWCKAIDKLYTYSWKGREVSTEELINPPGRPDAKIEALENNGQDPFKVVWEAVGGQAANTCTDLLRKYGSELFMKGELDRQAIANEENIASGSLDQRIKRCLDLIIEKAFLPILNQIGTEIAKACTQLLKAIYGKQKDGALCGREQRRQQVARLYELTVEQVRRREMDCGTLALSKLMEV